MVQTLQNVWRLLSSVWSTASDRHVGLIAAGVAFFGMFAIFPGIGAVISLFGILADPAIVLEQLALLDEIIPQSSYLILETQMERLLSARNDALGWASLISLLLAVWAARAGVSAMISGLNAIFNCPPRKGLKNLLVSVGLTISLVALGVTALLVVVLAPLLLAFFPIPGGAAMTLDMLRWVVLLIVLYLALSLLYRYGPNRKKPRIKWWNIGTVVVIVLWVAASVGLSVYLTNFANYNEVYGSIGAVIGMLLWLYVSAFLILLGATLNLHMQVGPKPSSNVP